MEATGLYRAIQESSILSPHSLRIFPLMMEEKLSREYKIPKRELLIEVCSLGIIPERYSRNHATYSAMEQKRLLSSSVFVVGMGGLGGSVLELLARVGIGRISCADGDKFEGSNLNRQAFSSESVLGQGKALIGYRKLSDISSISEYQCIDSFLNREMMCNVLSGNDIVIDALGGLRDKPLLAEVCRERKYPLVCSSIAGLCGYVSFVPVGGVAPTDWLGADAGIEEKVGNLPQTVSFASSCMVQMCIDFLLGKMCVSQSLLFDIGNFHIERVEM